MAYRQFLTKLSTRVTSVVAYYLRYNQRPGDELGMTNSSSYKRHITKKTEDIRSITLHVQMTNTSPIQLSIPILRTLDGLNLEEWITQFRDICGMPK